MPEWLICVLASIPLWLVVILVVRYGKRQQRAWEETMREQDAMIAKRRKELGL